MFFSTKSRARLLCATLLATGATALWPTVAAAQSTDTPQASKEQAAGDIIVTARRQNERLQDVPASVTAFSAETLDQARVKTGADAVSLTSGVTVSAGSVEAGDVQVNIRGLNGARDAESNIAIVVDGVQKSSKAALVQNQGVLQQIEVLKGPQGALYGRNAAAGAFVITTRKPGDRLEGQFTASLGNNGTHTVYGLLSGPISKSLGVSLAADWSETKGFYRNSFLPTQLNQTVYPGNSTNAASVDDRREWNLYGRAVWKPTDATEFDAKVKYGELRGAALTFNAVFQLPGLAAAFNNPLFNIDVNKHQFVFASNIDPLNAQSNFEASIRGSHDLNFATLTGYVSFNDFHNRLNGDGTSGAFGFFSGQSKCISSTTALTGFPVEQPFGIGGASISPPYSPTTCDGTLAEVHNQRDYSAELRLVAPKGNPLQWQFGGYYLHVARRDCLALELDVGRGYTPGCYNTNPDTRTEALIDDSLRTNVYAVFGSAEYEFLKGVKGSLALRYDSEQRRTENNVPRGARTQYVGNVASGFPNGTDTVAANYYLNPGLDPAYNPSGRLDPRSATFNQVQPKVTLSWKVSPDLNLFADWGIGFKAGGFNSGGSTAIINGFFNRGLGSGLTVNDTYRKETNSAFEAGFKGKLAGGRVSFSAAAYLTNVRDLQVFEFFVGTFGILREVENIDRVRLYGVEGDINVRVVPALSLFASANYTNSSIRANATRPYTVGNKSPLTPDYTINAGAQLNAPVGDDFKLTGRLEARVTGPTCFSAVQDNTVPTYFGSANYKKSRRSAYTTVDARLGVTRGRLSVSGYVNNLFDKAYLRDVLVTPEFGGDFVSPGDRRSYGIELGYRF